MRYLLDTCVVSDFAQNIISTRERIRNVLPTEIAISSITVAEIRYGISKASGTRKSVTIKEITDELFRQIEIIGLNKKEAKLAGDIRSDLELKGNIIGMYDILIAATAKAHDLIIVTSNEKEFKRVSGLKLENWRGE